MLNYDNILNDTITEIQPSGIRKFFDIAASMDDVISLGVGEPDFETPWKIRNAAIKSLERGKTGYSSNRGLAELRSEISKLIEKIAQTLPSLSRMKTVEDLRSLPSGERVRYPT